MTDSKYEEKTAPGYVAYAEDINLIIGAGFSEEERGVLDHKLAKYKEEQARKPVEAKYCIEVLFGKNYSLHKPSHGMLVAWENGAFEGSSQGSVYFCPSEGCGKVIPAGAQGGNVVFCPACKRTSKAVELGGGRLIRQTVQGWSQAIVNAIRQLGMSADIRVLYAYEDIRSASAREQARNMGGDVLGKVRRGRAVRIYLLRDIVKDTNNGADLVSRVRAFLEA